MSSDEGENTASPIQLDEVERAWETIRRFVVDWRIRDNNHSLGPTLALVQEQHDEARANLEDAEKEVDLWRRNFNVAMRERDEARADRDKAIAERDAVRNDCDAVIKQRNDARDSANKIAATLDTVQKQLAKLREERAAILEMLQ